MSTPESEGGWIGRNFPRVEDSRLLSGHAEFLDNLRIPGAKQVAIVRSPYAHARIRSIDAAAALDLPGVHAVVTGADVQALTRPFPVATDVDIRYYPMAAEKVVYVGEPVAAVVRKYRVLVAI